MSYLPHDCELLTEQGTYPCPICRCGSISTLSLMEAMSCSFCHHIFSTDFAQQSIAIADSPMAFSWRWNGKGWKSLRGTRTEFGWDALIIAFVFVLLPPFVVGFAAYLFPPLPGTPGAWFPIAWTIVVFFVHLACVIWLTVEYYQFPINLYARAIGRRWLGRLSN
ncbi:hypothetical protein [Oscillatoria sp. FACHB-1406]|uniref:hypothetical protein n=1 Tax=Oscillatoria sp. FACHB-1406 TaxID=2692846 RepID=UPI0016844CB9|nr:hypothetical protein [Oscillatoria sp. FACHB-1406]MBD2578349.1 hypothetical protein [Oscillatoria sp. FACHB-1406]